MSRGSQTPTAPSREMSVTDMAYSILKTRGKAMYYKELIDSILRAKSIAVENQGRVIAQIHTEINLDSRFFHKGHGEWGLRDWAPKPSPRPAKPRSGKAGASVPRSPRLLLDYDEAEDDLHERDEEEREDYRDEEEDNLAQEPDPAHDLDGDEWE